MTDNDGVPLRDANGFEICEHSERAPRAIVRHGVVVEVGAHVRGFAGLHLYTPVSRDGVLGNG